MSENHSRQGVVLDPINSGRADILLQEGDGALLPLFSKLQPSERPDPWALHFNFTKEEFLSVRELSAYKYSSAGRVGTRRRPRWRRDSILLWRSTGQEERYLELIGSGSIGRERLGGAFRVRGKRYQNAFGRGNLEHKNLLYIAGCGRSGTTLLQRMMRCFKDSHVARGERPFTAFVDISNSAERNLIVKRDATAWEVLEWLPANIRLIYCVRHPYDVLTSFHPGSKKNQGFYIQAERWLNEYLAYKRYCAGRPGEGPIVVRYEDLVDDPDGVQRILAIDLKLEMEKRFSQRKEELSARSIGKWKNNEKFTAHIRELVEVHGDIIKSFCQEFSYDATM